MPSLTLKRIFVVVISQALGLLLGYLLITVGFNMLPFISSIETPQAVTVAQYGIIYFLVTAVPLGIIVMIWLDALLDTRILPD